MLQPILLMLPWLGVYLRSRLPPARRAQPAPSSEERRP